MTEDTLIVTIEPTQRRAFPEWLNEGVALLLHLVATGRWNVLAERLRVQRQGGYSGIDGFLFLLLYFGSGQKQSISKFSQRVGRRGKKLAAVGGRKALPTQSSMSRILSAVDQDMVRKLAPWVLLEATGALELLQHPVMQTTDANGEGWHVFDYDPTKTVLRQRSLPRGEDLPPPRRLTDDFAKPGYTGRKRGEVQVSRAALQHAGSGLWLEGRLSAGNGEVRASLKSAIHVTTDVCEKLGHPKQRALLRCDGEFGSVPYLSMCLEEGLPALSRLNRPKLLDQAEVRRRIAEGTWYMVPDSGSGPRRSAMDLGMVTVRPGRNSVRDDGTAFEPIEVRVVVSRYEREGQPDHGRVIDGWQYELFAALQMPADAWPAPDVVAMYYGRGSEENRFAQEDRELGLDRIFSYNLGGQELASLVGLMVWNLRVVHGFHLNPPPTHREPAPAREPVVDDRPVPVGLVVVEEAPEPEPVEELPAQDPNEALADALRELDWSRLLHRRADWSFDREQGLLCCPAGVATLLREVANEPPKPSSKLSFYPAAGSCRQCPQRDGCVSSPRVNAIKKSTFNVPRATGDQIATLLSAVRLARRYKRPAQAPGRKPRTGDPLNVDFEADKAAPGSAQISVAPFLPAAARQAFRSASEALVFGINVKQPVVEPTHPYLATTPEERQRRRATWTQRLQWYALPEGSQARVVVHGGAALARTFPWAAQA